MDFRYKLAKETFKNKKVPPKRGLGESTVSDDQRGNRASDTAEDLNLLSLDKETVTPRQEEPEGKETSRRGFLSFLDQLEELGEKPGEKQKPGAKKPAAQGDGGAGDVAESHGQPPALPAEAKVGMFRRFWNWIKSIFKKAPPQKPDANLLQEEPAEETAPPEITIQVEKINGPDGATTAKPAAEAKEEEADADDKAMNRRNLMRGGIHFFAKPAVETVQKKIEQVNETVAKITRRMPLLRPPGAISEKRFLEACTRCDACIHACPKDAIKRTPKKMGFLIMGTPYIEPLKNPCVMCDGLPCISACEDNALLPVAAPAQVKMGYAIMDKNKCQAYGDVFCQQCVIDCPIPGAITQTPVDMKPVFHKNVCTGCGVCVRSCSTVNIPVAVKVKPQMVIESQLARKKRDREEKEERERQETEAAEQDPVQNSDGSQLNSNS